MQKSLPVPVHRSPFALVDALNQEWSSVLAADAEAREWEGSDNLDATLDRARRGDDATLHTLLRAAHAGSALAGRTVLQAQLGRLVQMARRDPLGCVDEYISALWCVLARYPLERRPVRIAANLALDTLKTVRSDRQWLGRSPAVAWPAGTELEALLGPADGEPGAYPEPGAAEVIAAGSRLRLIDEPTGRLLHTVYVEGLSGVDAAARHGTTPGSLRVRCSRAVHRLAAHADDLNQAA